MGIKSMKVYIVVIKNSEGNCNEYNDCFLDEVEALKYALSLSNDGFKVDVISKEFVSNKEVLENKTIEEDCHISSKIGEYYDDGKIKGIIASVDENDKPHLILGMIGPKEAMNWHNAMEYGETLKNGWHIPSKDELEEIWRNDGEITEILNRGLKKYNGVLLVSNDYYWSSSECDTANAYNVNTNNGNVDDIYIKYCNLYVRPVASLS